MDKHLTIEDYEKYVDESISDEYLVWLEPIQEHLLGCEHCQGRLQKFLVADALSEEFNTRAFMKMGHYVEQQKVIEKKTSLLENIKNVLQKMAKSELLENARESIENGLMKTISFNRSSYPGMLCTVRGEVTTQEYVKQEYVRRIEWEDGKVMVYVNILEQETLYVVELKMITSKGCEIQTEVAIPEKFAKEDELVVTFACETQEARYETTVVPIKMRK